MSSIGSRLRDQRERLGYNQSDFAERAGTTRKTQFNYETDARRPDADYLAVLATIGVDVLYILTGQLPVDRDEAVQTSEEAAMLKYFRAAEPAVRRAAMGALLSAVPTSAASGGMNMSNLGDGNVQIGSIGGSYSAAPPKPSPRKKTK